MMLRWLQKHLTDISEIRGSGEGDAKRTPHNPIYVPPFFDDLKDNSCNRLKTLQLKLDSGVPCFIVLHTQLVMKI